MNPEKILSLPTTLKAKVVGQDAALDSVAEAVLRGETGVSAANRPRGCFMLAGPSGVGKTETCKALAAQFGPLRDTFAMVNMSEFQDEAGIGRMLGGEATEGVLKRRLGNSDRGILLFDEFEKGSPETRDLFLQIAEEGEIGLTSGEKLDLRQRYVFLTTNIGAGAALSGGGQSAFVRKGVELALRAELRPEMFNRYSVLTYLPLGIEEQKQIARLEVEKSLRRIEQAKGIEILADERAVEVVRQAGCTEQDGARPLRAAVEKLVEGTIARGILDGMGDMRLLPDSSGRALIANPLAG